MRRTGPVWSSVLVVALSTTGAPAFAKAADGQGKDQAGPVAGDEDRGPLVKLPSIRGMLLQGAALAGTTVSTPQGEPLGTVDEVLIDPRSGRVSHVVLSVGGTLGIGETRYAVPWSAMRVSTRGGFSMTMAREVLGTAPAFEAEWWDEAGQPEEAADATWDSDTEYGRLYDQGTVDTVRGRVVRVESLSPLAGMSRGIQLTLKGEDGHEESVHLGPSSYLDAQDVNFKPGEVVEVRGSRTELEGEPIRMAVTVRRGEQTVTLRDEEGSPLWGDAEGGSKVPGPARDDRFKGERGRSSRQ